MPLRNPGTMPHVPKTRKRSLEKIKSGTPDKKKRELEYTAITYFHFDTLLKKQFYVVAVSSVKEFTILNYDLSVDVQRLKDKIDISLLGLKTKHSYLVQPQAASALIKLENLFGQFTLSFVKQDGSINSFLVEYNIFKRSITVLKEILPKKKNNHKFCSLTTAPHLFTFESGPQNI